ncbi:type II toxin-antitoxin system HicB family antitoxin [Candidatus Woesearchaeota archaeon]|nr:type II toxin-antitoxin system HicB family antitoxin [Candidatus Woesearchaeota archaeon]HIH37311.1 type II toxin-antitoxin system HicB family antitoxin [Candidatus Woesearchaeota archaeon]HIH48233.1 type II toxin-antitoxin system HicB family antitoxin [Candidatus Woesearchaeota archaeon]HIJ04287.1 type II toxin-antitoxin system HicB family antitoxin [Candidatus Woesearchaeota archaeon]
MATYTAVIRREEDMFVATCPEIGTASQGKSVDEAVANLKEATELYLEEFPTQEKPITMTFEVAESVP